jgi:hypothetical protein
MKCSIAQYVRVSIFGMTTAYQSNYVLNKLTEIGIALEIEKVAIKSNIILYCVPVAQQDRAAAF